MNWVIEYDSDWLVICKICNKSFNKLWWHIRMKHNMLTIEYRKQFWLDNKARLMSESSILLARKNNKDNYNLVVTDNLLNKWKGTRYKLWYKWRTRNQIREQTRIRLQNNLFIKK